MEFNNLNTFNNVRTVTLPIEEYNDLLQDQKDKKTLMEQLAADAEDRGFLVQQLTHVYKRDLYGGLPVEDYGYFPEKNTLKIFSKDEVLAEAQKENNRLSEVCEMYAEAKKKLEKENERLKSRGFFARLFNLKR